VNVLPFSPTQAAAFVDKLYETCRARCALAGAALYRRVDDDGQVVFVAGMRRFATLDQLEDWLDQIRGDE